MRLVVAILALCAALQIPASLSFMARLAPQFSNLPVQAEGVFEPNGNYEGEPLPGDGAIRKWGSWAGRDDHTGALRLGPFVAPPKFRIAIGGYPANPANAVYLENKDATQRERLALEDVGERWKIVEVRVPKDWIGKQVTLVARDQATEVRGWLALSEPLRGGEAIPFYRALAGFGMNGLWLGTLWLACLAMLNGRNWVSSAWEPLVAAGMVALMGYVAFWMYFAHPVLGKCFSVTLLVGAAVFAWRAVQRGWSVSGETVVLCRLMVAVGLFYFAVLYLFPSALDPFSLAAQRWGKLPGDNYLPQLLAHETYWGGDLRWTGSEWLASDRPPLQSGWLLLSWPVGAISLLTEAAFGAPAAVWFQLLWVFAAYGLFRMLGMSLRRSVAWTVLLATSGFFLLHSMFTWPKLGAGALLCGTFGLWIFPSTEAHSRMQVAAGALLAALAWLAHGSVAFSLLALLPWFAWRFRARVRDYLLVALVFAGLAGPWTAFQKWYAPPGDRLIKWHLAGQEKRDARGAWQAISENYHALSWRQIAENKWANLTFQKMGTWPWLFTVSPELAQHRRNDEFFITSRAVTWWLLGLLALPWVLVRCHREPAAARLGALFGWATLTMLVWCLLMFLPKSAIVHQGSFAMMLAFFAAFSCALARVSPLAWWAIAAFQAVSFVATWLAPSETVNGTVSYAAVALLIAAMAFAMFTVFGSASSEGANEAR